MAGATTFPVKTPNHSGQRRATAEAPLIKWILITITLGFLGLFLLFPLFIVFKEAFREGWLYFYNVFFNESSQTTRYTREAIKLTLLVAAITVPLNTVFGVAAAWCITRFHFRGRSFLTTLLDMPLWVSPVVGGLLYVLIFGRQGWLPPDTMAHLLSPLAAFADWIGMPKSGDTMTNPSFITQWLAGINAWLHSPKIIFAVPGIVLATTFVTFPFVARGLIPLMQAQGAKEEEAAMTLGANGWQIFTRVTLPKIKWGLLYGVILCNARAMGEFGAVSVVSGHINGKTNTIPLNIEILYANFDIAAAFAVSSLLSLLALVTLVIKTYAEWKAERQLAQASHSINQWPTNR